MTGAVIIDGTDIASLGAIMLRGGDHELISFPARKEPVMIEWPEHDGFEISDDLPVYEAKKMTVDYYLKGDETTFPDRLNAFADLHFVSAYNSIFVREFDKTFSLRFAGITSLKISRGFTVDGNKNARISIDYVMDNPTQFLGSGSPSANREPDTQVTIGAVDLAAFGIIVKEVYGTAMRLTPKSGIVYNSRYDNGQTSIFATSPKRAKQDISISCAMICEDRAAFMSNWNALWTAVNVSSVEIGLTAAGKTYKAFYKSMDAFRKRPWTNRAFAEFELNFTGYEDI